MRTATTLIIAGLSLAIAAPAVAQMRDTSVRDTVFSLEPEERFATTDANDDGKVSQDEYKAILNPEAAQYILAIWERLDTDEDGYLTPEEMTPPPRSRFGARRPPAPQASAD